MKLPIDQRPDIATLERFFDVTPSKRELFTIDLQNDCDCAVELYDACPGEAIYWDDGPKIYDGLNTDLLRLPIHNGVLTNAIVDQMIVASGLTPEVVRARDFISYGIITGNLRGWGMFCWLARPAKTG